MVIRCVGQSYDLEFRSLKGIGLIAIIFFNENYVPLNNRGIVICAGISDESLPRRRNRVAMIEDSEGILVRIGVDGVKRGEVEVRLLIGIGLSSWPASADYPQRIPLYHCDALLHYTAAQSVRTIMESLRTLLLFSYFYLYDRFIPRSLVHRFPLSPLVSLQFVNIYIYIYPSIYRKAKFIDSLASMRHVIRASINLIVSFVR